MSYRSTDRICDFEFHYSRIDFVSFENANLTITAKALNIHQNTEQNSYDTDMQCSAATITFINAVIGFYTDGITYKCINGEFVPESEEAVVYTDKHAEALFLKEAKHGFEIYGVKEKMQGNYKVFEFDAGGIAPFFSCGIYYESVEISWDSFEGKAWYEEKKEK